jgi:cytochrome c556
MPALTRSLATATALVLGVMLAAPAGADPEDMIKYRQGVMTALGGHATAMAQIVRGKVALSGQLEGHAQSVVALTRDIPALFPEGSDFGETDAKPEVWKKRAEFEKAGGEASKAADALLVAVRGGDRAAIGPAFDGLSKTCKGCHEDFRVKR